MMGNPNHPGDPYNGSLVERTLSHVVTTIDVRDGLVEIQFRSFETGRVAVLIDSASAQRLGRELCSAALAAEGR
jgi:hypothetical protein